MRFWFCVSVHDAGGQKRLCVFCSFTYILFVARAVVLPAGEEEAAQKLHELSQQVNELSRKVRAFGLTLFLCVCVYSICCRRPYFRFSSYCVCVCCVCVRLCCCSFVSANCFAT